MDILEMLKQAGVELPEDKRGDFDKEFRKAYKSVAELNKVKDELKAKSAEVEDLTQKIEESTKSTGSLEELKKQYEDKIAGLTTELSDIKYNSLLGKALAGIEFSSERVKNSVLADIKAKGFKETDKGELDGINDFLKELYEKEPTTFKSVDSNLHTWGTSTDNTDTQTKPNIFGKIL